MEDLNYCQEEVLGRWVSDSGGQDVKRKIVGLGQNETKKFR